MPGEQTRVDKNESAAEKQAAQPSQNLMGPDAGPIQEATAGEGTYHHFIGTTGAAVDLPVLGIGLDEIPLKVSLSADMRRTAAASGNNTLRLRWNDGADAVVREDILTGNNATFQRENLTVEIPAGAEKLNVRAQIGGGTPTSVGAVRRLMLNRGPVALPFEEPPLRTERETALDIKYDDGTPVENLKPGEAGANITETRTAAAITGQGALATKNSVDLATGEVIGKTADNIGETTARKWAAEAGANKTETRTSADTSNVGGKLAADVKSETDEYLSKRIRQDISIAATDDGKWVRLYTVTGATGRHNARVAFGGTGGSLSPGYYVFEVSTNWTPEAKLTLLVSPPSGDFQSIRVVKDTVLGNISVDVQLKASIGSATTIRIDVDPYKQVSSGTPVFDGTVGVTLGGNESIVTQVDNLTTVAFLTRNSIDGSEVCFREDGRIDINGLIAFNTSAEIAQDIPTARITEAGVIQHEAALDVLNQLNAPAEAGADVTENAAVAQKLDANGRLALDGVQMVRIAGPGSTRVSNPLSAWDNVITETARIQIAAHDRFDGSATGLSYNSGTVTPLSFSTFYYVYADDPTFAGGAVTYVATQNSEDLGKAPGRYFLGSLVTPANGAGSTGGGGGGGGGGEIP